jgi:demethylmenaquinone methyltransferase / 2-methoxy-6-polyprenyl-1,4-benzoquinol methylase
LPRRPGLQHKWSYVISSLQMIVSNYEVASSRISLFADRRLRDEVVSFAVRKGELVLDLGAGPGTMSRLVKKEGAYPVLLDVSRSMLEASDFPDRVQGTFEDLPFMDGAFDAVVSGFAVRDSRDFLEAVSRVHAALKPGGRFAFCDLGKPDSHLAAAAVAFYLRTAPSIIGMATAGRSGLRYGSLFDTYMLLYHNSEVAAMLSRWFSVEVHETQMGGSVVFTCRKDG